MKEAMLEISIKLNISMQEFLMGLVLAVGAPNADAPEGSKERGHSLLTCVFYYS